MDMTQYREWESMVKRFAHFWKVRERKYRRITVTVGYPDNPEGGLFVTVVDGHLVTGQYVVSWDGNQEVGEPTYYPVKVVDKDNWLEAIGHAVDRMGLKFLAEIVIHR